MKNRLLLFSLTLTLLGSCTKDFQQDNTDPNAATQAQLDQDYQSVGGYITQMEQNIVPVLHNGTTDLNHYQLIYNLNGDNYSGQQGSSDDFGGNDNTNNYDPEAVPTWTSALFTNGYANAMAPWASVQLKSAGAPYSLGIALILKVFAMDQLTDAYGPIPYSKFSIGGLSLPYDDQESIYHAFFNELDSATSLLQNYMAANPGLTPLQKIDLIYASDFSKWIKFANTLRLRLAMRIVYADPATAQTQAEAAAKAGVMTSNGDNAILPIDGSNLWNPLYQTCYSYNDTRMGATMESILKGYNDPRAALLFDKVPVPAGSTPDYHGIRTGITVNTSAYRTFSTMNLQNNSAFPMMVAAEAYFLLAEGALRGWNMGGSAQSYYEMGVTTAFSQPMGGSNTAAGDATAYLADSTSMPAPYVDPVSSANNGDPVSTITIRWDPTANFETSLERIMTQKWIALFPQGLEAWAEFRRTGYPRVYQVLVNKGSYISSQAQIRRLNFPQSEYQQNSAGVMQGLSELINESSGAAVQIGDNGGTKLWWDKKP